MARLTERTVQTAKTGKHGDGDGLYLVVSGTGRKKWVLRYQVAGVRKDKGLGAYPAVGLKDARDRAIEARKLVACGIDPIEAERAARKAAKPTPTFREIAKLVIEDAQSKSVNAKVRYQWERHLGPAYSAPLLDRPVHEITALDVAAVLAPRVAIQARGRAQALSGDPACLRPRSRYPARRARHCDARKSGPLG